MKRLLRASQGGQPVFKTVLLKPRIVEGETCVVPGRFQPERQEGRPTGIGVPVGATA